MRNINNLTIIAGLLALLLGLCSCNALALSGAKKYKVDLSNILLNAKTEIENNGEVSDKTMNKLDTFLEKSREEYGSKGSFIRTTEALDQIKTAKAEYAAGRNGFMNYKQAEQLIFQAQDMLKTEVKDD